MFVTVNGTILDAIDCYSYRYQNGKLVLRMTVAQDSIGHDELKVLLKTNTGDIVKNDNGNIETYTGFRYTLTILDKDDVYECEIECVSEAERKIGDLQNEVNVQEATIEELQNIISEQNELINMQIDTVAMILTDILPELMGDDFDESAE